MLVDSHTLQDDYVELARSQGVHLCGQLLLVLGVREREQGKAHQCSGLRRLVHAWLAEPLRVGHERQVGCLGRYSIVACRKPKQTAVLPFPPYPQLGSQTLHMLQLLQTGRLHYLHAIGPHCRVRELPDLRLCHMYCCGPAGPWHRGSL